MGLNPSIPLSIQGPKAPENPLDQYARVLAIKNQATESQLQQQAQQSNAIALKTQQQQYDDQQTLRQLAPKFSGKDKDGNGTYDLEGLATAAEAKGVSPALTNQIRTQHYAHVEAAAKAGTAQLDLEQKHNQKRYQIIEGIKGIDDPNERETAYQQGLNSLATDGMDVSHLPKNAPSNKDLEAYESQLGMHNQILTDAKSLAETNEKNATAAEKEWQKFPELGVMVNTKTGEQRQVAGTAGAMTPGMMESKYVNIQQKKALGQPLGADEAAFSKGFEKYKQLIPQFQVNMANNTGANTPGSTPASIAKQFGMNQEAFDQAAEKYSSTGLLPPVGRGPSGIALQRALMNRSGELHPNAVLAANSAEYKANSASLSKLQSNLDNVSAFENTANKNLDLFTGLAKKAIDSGIPLLNTPLRAAAAGLGSEDQAALNAARQVAVNEIAKVTSNPGLSGQLSDSARHEIEAFNPANATYGQTLRVAQVLKQDMANRHQSTAEQIADIQKRLGNKSATPQGEPASSSSGSAAHVISINGKQYKYKGSGPTNDLKSYDAIQ